ncbi:MAG TPA: DUF421 domain-containing protein [Clostridia bacterium]|nr:DUF421 domain-containing protein [Clostridia bacterium]
MDLLRVALTSLFSLVVLFVLTKLMGDKQISQMSLFDYIIGITIGSIAAEMATELEGNPLHPMTAMVVYGIVAVLISIVCQKFLPFRRLMSGKPILLYDNGILIKKNLLKARIDLSDFLTQCRVAGYFDLNDLQTAVMEQNGQISFLPISSNRPVNPKDLNISPQQNYINANVVLDGRVMKKALAQMGKNENWLVERLKAQGIKSVSDVFLATCDTSGNLTVYKINNKNITFEKIE